MSYRSRCYDAYINTHWKYSHKFSNDEYEQFCRIGKKRFAQILPKDKLCKILDVGCGAGYFLYFLKKEGYSNAEGIDLSDEQLALSRQSGATKAHKADMFTYLQTCSNSFDCIIASDIIEHLTKEEVMSFLDLAYAAIKEGGLILVRTMNAGSLLGGRYLFTDFTHETSFTKESLSQVLRVAGYSDVVIAGENPTAQGFLSFPRLFFWIVVKLILKGYFIIENGLGRNGQRCDPIFEPRIYGLGYKKTRKA